MLGSTSMLYDTSPRRFSVYWMYFTCLHTSCRYAEVGPATLPRYFTSLALQPGLGNVGEVTSELTTAVTSMLGEMNQHILAVPTASAPRYPKRPHSTALLPGVPLDACRWALTALSHFDVVLELSVSGAAGEKARLNLVRSAPWLAAACLVSPRFFFRSLWLSCCAAR